MAGVAGTRDVYQLGLSSAIFKRKPNDQGVNNVTILLFISCNKLRVILSKALLALW